MSKNSAADKITGWEAEGYDSDPSVLESVGGEELMRAYSLSVITDTAGNKYGSRKLSNCFFVFASDFSAGRIGKVDVAKFKLLDAQELEANLNAGLWNNTYQLVQRFSIRDKNLPFKIGPIGHSIRTNERFNVHDPKTKSTKEVTTTSVMDWRANISMNFMQVTLINHADISKLSEVGQPQKVANAERYLGSRSGVWN